MHKNRLPRPMKCETAKTEESHTFIAPENGNVNLKESFNFAGNLNLLFTHSTIVWKAKHMHEEEEEAATAQSKREL